MINFIQKDFKCQILLLIFIPVREKFIKNNHKMIKLFKPLSVSRVKWLGLFEIFDPPFKKILATPHS